MDIRSQNQSFEASNVINPSLKDGEQMTDDELVEWLSEQVEQNLPDNLGVLNLNPMNGLSNDLFQSDPISGKLTNDNILFDDSFDILNVLYNGICSTPSSPTAVNPIAVNSLNSGQSSLSEPMVLDLMTCNNMPTEDGFIGQQETTSDEFNEMLAQIGCTNSFDNLDVLNSNPINVNPIAANSLNSGQSSLSQPMVLDSMTCNNVPTVKQTLGTTVANQGMQLFQPTITQQSPLIETQSQTQTAILVNSTDSLPIISEQQIQQLLMQQRVPQIFITSVPVMGAMNPMTTLSTTGPLILHQQQQLQEVIKKTAIKRLAANTSITSTTAKKPRIETQRDYRDKLDQHIYALDDDDDAIPGPKAKRTKAQILKNARKRNDDQKKTIAELTKENKLLSVNNSANSPKSENLIEKIIVLVADFSGALFYLNTKFKMMANFRGDVSSAIKFVMKYELPHWIQSIKYSSNIFVNLTFSKPVYSRNLYLHATLSKKEKSAVLRELIQNVNAAKIENGLKLLSGNYLQNANAKLKEWGLLSGSNYLQDANVEEWCFSTVIILLLDNMVMLQDSIELMVENYLQETNAMLKELELLLSSNYLQDANVEEWCLSTVTIFLRRTNPVLKNLPLLVANLQETNATLKELRLLLGNYLQNETAMLKEWELLSDNNSANFPKSQILIEKKISKNVPSVTLYSHITDLIDRFECPDSISNPSGSFIEFEIEDLSCGEMHCSITTIETVPC